MKKRVLATLLSGVLAASLLVGCGGGKKETTADSTAETKTEVSSEGGSVYYLNFKPEQDQQWQDLAAAYTAETGIPVSVVTAASGDYEKTLMAEMGKTDAPTLFQVNGPVGLANWKDYCYDLSGTAVYGELADQGMALKDGDAVQSIAYVMETYGLITNLDLLDQAGYKPEDIQSFADLKKVAEDITARKDELGFAAFTSAGMDGSSDWRFKTHLANMPIHFEFADAGLSATEALNTDYLVTGTYLDNYRAMWDLYINNSTCNPEDLSSKTGDDSRNEFLEGKAVFFQNGSWEYGAVSEKVQNVTMIPLYIGVGDEATQGLCAGTENYWCVNSQAAPEDIQATLDFMYWCVSSEAGVKAMCEDMGFDIPFKAALESTNGFINDSNAMVAAGKSLVTWDFTAIPSEEWKNGVGAALTAYAADQTDDKWEAVVTAFVDGWETEAALAAE